MKFETILKDYGLNAKESAVYLALVKRGASSVRNIASESSVNRGTSYDILKSLVKQGLVAYYDQENKQYFVAESPEKLIDSIEGKQRDLEIVKEKISKVLPNIKTEFNKSDGKPVTKLFEGEKGIRSILTDVITSVATLKDKIYHVYSSADLRKNIYKSMPDFSDKRIKQEIKVQTIALGSGGRTVGLDERKWIKSKTKLTNAVYEIIYAGKVAFISLDDSENPVGVVIENTGIYNTQKMIFEFDWSKL